MKKFSFSEIEDAFDFVSFGYYGENNAIVCRKTGEIMYQSEHMDIDEEEEDLDWDTSVEVPHKYDLKLGKELAFRFTRQHLTDEYDFVVEMFHQKRGFSRFKSFIERRGMLQKWYDFENEKEASAIRAWCEENEIELND